MLKSNKSCRVLHFFFFNKIKRRFFWPQKECLAICSENNLLRAWVIINQLALSASVDWNQDGEWDLWSSRRSSKKLKRSREFKRCVIWSDDKREVKQFVNSLLGIPREPLIGSTIHSAVHLRVFPSKSTMDKWKNTYSKESKFKERLEWMNIM